MKYAKFQTNLIYVPNMLKTFKIFLHFNNVEQLHLIFEHWHCRKSASIDKPEFKLQDQLLVLTPNQIKIGNLWK